MRLFVAATLLLLGLAAVPNTQAADLPSLPIDLAVQPALMECGSFVANHDGGENWDTWNYCATPQCGCMCPYVGGGAQIEAAGQERGAYVVASCQSGYALQQGEADGGEPVTVFPVVGGGGLSSTSTSAAAPISICQAVNGDWDRDGESETWNVCATPACGCACPVVGAGIILQALDQERGAWVATSGCQTGFATMTDEGDDGALPVKPFVWTWGLPPIEIATA